MRLPTSNLSVKVRSKRNLEASWRVIHENARSSKSPQVRADIEKFEADASGNLERLYRSLQRGTFEFPPARGIAIPKDKGKGPTTNIRPIVLAEVQSRIVQRAILNVLTDLPAMSPYLNNPNSFGGVRRGGQNKLAAVPAAIAAVLEAVGSGAKFVMCADIASFFTRIPKSAVTEIVSRAANDDELMKLFERAIHVELANMDQLRRYIDKFPIEDIGVAQGNSLSPLLGNILLHHFDQTMNDGDCRCVRYIDDFIVVAPTAKAANARMRLARQLLASHNMSLSEAKSSKDPIPITNKIEFLGIELSNGLIRPSRKAQTRLVASISQEFDESVQCFAKATVDTPVPKRFGLTSTMKRVDGVIKGWGKHYRFCNDKVLLANLDARIDELIASYLGRYARYRDASPASRRQLLGIEELSGVDLLPLQWPSATIAARSNDQP